MSLEAGSNGDEVIDEDSFRVRVVGSGAAGIVAGEDFTLNNW